ncbi:protein of unknown function [Pseudobutyrivibrio sp. AR14]|uniref:YwqH-like family protein n=1 Tax=Pseudobutyrivibrio sp. AR14 TaxID=1520804 RepID=UPI0008877E48|nr:DUF5082 family protein [Pseudobutyrivibrio sp. AR14]SCY47150.1 protein of unknown function [Pseudobutyrivibrio sp. AR14]
MSEKSDLQRRIGECNAEIEQIKKDIRDMESESREFSGYSITLQGQETSVRNYDISHGQTWNRDLCDGAIEDRSYVGDGIHDVVDACETTIKELSACIDKANQMIKDLQAEIGRCNARIRAIEEEEERERERQRKRNR